MSEVSKAREHLLSAGHFTLILAVMWALCATPALAQETKTREITLVIRTVMD